MRSVLELNHLPFQTRNSHAWFWNSGSDLPNYWSTQNHNGTQIYAMSDEVNGGMRITTGATSGNNGTILQGDINHFSHNSSVCITLSKHGHSNMYTETGLMEKKSNPPDTSAFYDNDTASSFQRLRTGLNNSLTSVDSSQTPDTVWHRSVINLRAAACVWWLDDVLEGVSTTTLPDVALQLFFRTGSNASGAKAGRWRYAEAYNL